MLTFPLFGGVNSSMPFSPVVLAGHAVSGGSYCDGVCLSGRCSVCGADCSDGGKAMTSNGEAEPVGDADLDSGLLLLLFAIYLGIRIK
jgi:hypothetical protein